MYRIGIDIGGTFTDFTVVNEAGEVKAYKVASRPDNFFQGVRQGIDLVCHELGLSDREFIQQCQRIIHGATIATNTIIQRNGPITGLITTKGFRDVLEFTDAHKPEPYNLKMKRPDPLVPRFLRIGVEERTNYLGEEETPLNHEDVRRVVQIFQEEKVGSIAVALLWANMNPDHERRVKEIVEAQFPGVPVVLSSDVLPMIREWERTSATVLGAYTLPGIESYLTELRQYFMDRGLSTELLITQCNGGSAPVEQILKVPMLSIGSGPAAAPAAAAYYLRDLDTKDSISVDMGGTSFDVCLIRGGEPTITKEQRVENMPLGVMATDINSIGAGGGSIAFIDRGGALDVGPDSAGAQPGPACYNQGGAEPTVTDADLVLGYINPDFFVGGRFPLNADMAEKAIEEKIAGPLGIGVVEAAAGVFHLINFKMVKGIAAVSVERGIDPRDYVLVVGGGAGPVHAGRLAQELGIKRVVIPKQAGVFSSFGMTVTDITHDYLRTLPALSGDLDLDEINQLFEELESQCLQRLTEEGIPEDRVRFVRYADACYDGQMHEIIIPVPGGKLTDIDQLTEPFHEAHERLYTFRIPENPVRFFHWRLKGVGELEVLNQPEHSKAGKDPGTALQGNRDVYFAELSDYSQTPIYDGGRLAHGNVIEGPAVIEEPTTTIVVFPEHRVEVTKHLDYHYSLP